MKKNPSALPKKPPPLPPRPRHKPNIAPKAPIPSSRAVEYQSFADSLVRGNEPTILFQGPPNRLTNFAAYTATSFTFLLVAWYGYYGLFDPDIEPNSWNVSLKGLVIVATVALTFLGSYFFLGTLRRIRKITAMPINGNVTLRLEYRPAFPLPWRENVVVIAKPTDLTLEKRIVDPRTMLGPEGMVEMARRKKEIEATNAMPFYTAPIKKFSIGTHNLFLAFRNIMFPEGYIYLKIAGKNGAWKLDTLDGVFLDGGKALNKIVNYDHA